MKTKIAFVALITVIFFSCKQSKQEMILGAWKGAKLENPSMDTFFRQSQNYIDTIGKNGSLVTNMELYGTNNMDSLRKTLQEQFDSSKSMQLNVLLNTVFTFKKNIIVISFNGVLDTSKWFIDKNGALQLEEMSGEGKGTKTKMDIVSLTEQELKLKIEEDGTFSTVTFKKSAEK